MSKIPGIKPNTTLKRDLPNLDILKSQGDPADDSLERLERQGRNLISRFYVRRFFRIYPLSVFVVLFIYFLHIPRWFRLGVEPYGPVRLWSSLLLA